MRLDPRSPREVVRLVGEWARNHDSRYVCACNVHMVMEAYDDPPFRRTVNEADLVVPDGVPLVWVLRLLGAVGAQRVYGPQLMLATCSMAETENLAIGLFGSTPEVIRRLSTNLADRFPNLNIAYAHSPSTVDLADSSLVVRQMNDAHVGVLFVALGCPKQERWMQQHRGRVPAAMIGVGAAFDFLSHSKPQAPRILGTLGLEWAFRLASEPRRLWRRYAIHNPRFIWLVVHQLMHERQRPR